MTNESSVPRPITSGALRSLSISQRGTTHLLNRVQRATERATAFNAPRLTTGARSLDYFSSRIAERFPPLASKYETRAMSKPRQDLPLAESSVPALSPTEPLTDLPAIDAAAPAPSIAPRAPASVQRAAFARPTSAPRPTDISANSEVPATPASLTATARVQRAPLESGSTEANDAPINRSTLPSITSQLRQMRPSTMPKPKETSTSETGPTSDTAKIAATASPLIQRAVEPEAMLSSTPPTVARPGARPVQTDSPLVRRKRAQITEVTANTSEPPNSSLAATPIETRPPLVQRAVDDEPAADVPPSTPSAPTHAREAAAPIAPAEPSAPLSPRQLARLVTSAKTNVQRQADDASPAPRSEPAPEAPNTEVRLRRFVQAVQREALAFTGQTDDQGSGITDQDLGVQDQVEAIQHTPDQVVATSPTQVAARVQRMPDPTSEIEPAPSSPTPGLPPTIQRAVEPTNTSQPGEVFSPAVAPSAAAESTDVTAPTAESARVAAPSALAAPRVQRAVEHTATVPTPPATVSTDVATPANEITPTAPILTVQRTEMPENDQLIDQKAVADAEKPTISAAGEAISRSPAPFSGEKLSTDVLPFQTDSHPLRTDALPPQTDSHPLRTDALPPQTDSHPLRMDAHPSQTDSHPSRTDSHPLRTDALPPQTDNHPLRTDAHPSQTDSHPTQTDARPTATVQRAVAPEADRAVEATRGESITARLRQRIADQAVQRRQAETESSTPQSDDSAATLEAASPVQPTPTRTEVQRVPDTPVIQRTQADQSDAAEPAAPVERQPSATTIAPVARIQRAIEPTVSAAPVNRVQRVTEEDDHTAAPPIDLDQLARQVYPIVKRMIAIERERRG